MYRLLPIIVICLSSIWLNGQNSSTLNLTCNLDNCAQAPSLFQFNGLDFEKVLDAEAGEDPGTYIFKVPLSKPQYYYLGYMGKRMKILLLGTEDNVVIKGNCKAIQAAAVMNSELNNDYESLKRLIKTYDNQMKRLATQYREFANDPENQEEIVQKMSNLDDSKLYLIDSLKKVNPFLAKIAQLDTYLSFQNHGQDHPNEVMYFAKNYFQLADLKDPDYNNIVYLYEAFRKYTNTLTSIGLQKEPHAAFISNMLSQLPPKSQALHYALGGVVSTLKQKNHPNFAIFAEQYIKELEGVNPQGVASLQQQVNQSKAFLTGAVAPDFTQKTPDDQDLSLSDLRGKVVLVDFWASWCGPCRRENPNVVKMYNKYKEKGFDILGVSLDRTKDRWVGAIEKDGLEWNHVSDLKGWKSSAAALYGVRSIPHTVLLDKEGRIIARNLRGPKLEAKLAEIFGE